MRTFRVSRTCLRLVTFGVVLSSLTSPAYLAADSVEPRLKLAPSRPWRDPLTVRVLIYGPVPFGAYTVQVSFDPAALELMAVEGGKTAEFSAPPLSDPAAFARGTVRFSAFQARRLDGPIGKVHLATLRFRPRGAPRAGVSSGRELRSTYVRVEAITVADTHGAKYRPPPRRAALRYRAF